MRGNKLINSRGITKARYEGMLARLANEQEKNSTGAFGKCMEANIRYYLGKWDDTHSMNKNDFRARTMKSNDYRIKIEGHYYKIEIKTGCGDLSYNVEGVNEDELLSDADYVVWIPLTKGVDDENFTDFSYVFTRAGFIELLYAMGSVKKVNKQFVIPEICDKLNVRYVPSRRWTQIATFENCKGKLEVLYSVLDSTPTLKDFVEILKDRA